MTNLVKILEGPKDSLEDLTVRRGGSSRPSAVAGGMSECAHARQDATLGMGGRGVAVASTAPGHRLDRQLRPHRDLGHRVPRKVECVRARL